MPILDWVSVAAVAGAALYAFLAARRIRALNEVAKERRLARLAAMFYALLVAFVAEALGAVLVLSGDPVGLREGVGVLDVLYWTRHGAWLASILFAAFAIGTRAPGQRAPVMAAWLLAAEPVLLIVEGVGLLYLVVRSGLNHVRKTNVGSLEVALGFAFLSVARFLPFLLYAEGPVPLGAPHLVVSFLMLAGSWSLMMVVPGRAGRRGTVG